MKNIILTKEQGYALAVLRDKIDITVNQDGPSTIRFPVDKIAYGDQSVFSVIDRELAKAIEVVKTINEL